MTRLLRRYTLLLLMLAVAAGAVPAVAGSVRLHVEMPRGKRSIAVGELFYITYEVTDVDAKAVKPSSVPGARIAYFDCTGQSSRFSSVNGRTSQSFSYTYTLTLRASKSGTYSFGPVTVGGVKSNTVTYTIGNEPAAGGNAGTGSQGSSAALHKNQSGNKPQYIGKGDGNLFLKATVSKTTAYEQEALVYTVKLYTTYAAIKFIGATAAPKFEGFVVEESKDISTSLDYETYGGKTYATAVIARYIIFPQMTGALKVLGNTYTVSVDENEYYHDPFWGKLAVSKPLQLNVTPDDLVVNVKPLPSPRPADFSGGVGRFSMTSSLAGNNFASNQASSIVYTVTGTGNLKYIKLPELNSVYPPELEVYTPQTDVKTTVGRSNVSGTVRFDYSFMPLEAGRFDIPEVSLVYFDPESGQYKRAVARGYHIDVAKGKDSDKSQTLARLRFDSRLMAEEQELSAVHEPYVRTVVYWLFYIIPFLLLVAVMIYHRHYLKELSDIASLKSKRASKVARSRLRAAYRCMQKRDGDHFYDEMLAALWGYISDKLKMTTSELTRQNIRQKLDSRGLPAAVSERFIGLIDECEYAKYTPTVKLDNMEQIYEAGVEIIDSVEKALGRRAGETAVINEEREIVARDEAGVLDRVDKEIKDSFSHSPASEEYVNSMNPGEPGHLPEPGPLLVSLSEMKAQEETRAEALRNAESKAGAHRDDDSAAMRNVESGRMTEHTKKDDHEDK